MKFINEYTGKEYATLAECEASEKRWLEQNKGSLQARAEAFLGCKTIENAMEYRASKICTPHDKEATLSLLKTMYPYSSVDEFAKYANYRVNSHDPTENKFRYLWWYAKYPHIEQLLKANFLVGPISSMLSCYWKSDSGKFEKLFHKGTTLQEITGLKNYMIPFVKDIDEWSTYEETTRFLMKNAKGKEDCELWDTIAGDLGITRVREIKYLLNNGYFTLKTLKNYLDRLDMHQAIGKYEGVILTKKYVVNCKKLKIDPVFDQPSIKRDLDVTNREILRAANALVDQKFIDATSKYKYLEYENDKFKVVVPKDAADLRQEGCSQHNCVNGYKNGIADGYYKVLFVRRKSRPDKSYVTMEIRDNINGPMIVQYKAAYNSVPDTEALVFKNEYERFLSTIKKN